MNDPTSDSLATNPAALTSRNRFSWKLIAITLLLAAIGWSVKYALQDRTAQCKGHLKALVSALHTYHGKYGSFPPAYTVNADGKKLHSWRSLLLPFVGQERLYSMIRFDEPWDSPHNKPFSRRSLEIFTCPCVSNVASGRTNYFAVVGPVTMWPEQYAVKLSDIYDDKSLTACLMEANVVDISWMEPRDLTREEAIDLLQMSDGGHGLHDKWNHVAMIDGHVRGFASYVGTKNLIRIMSISGGAPYPGVNWPSAPVPDEIDFTIPQDAAVLKRTEVWPVTNRPIEPEKSIVYCSTFQIAWDRARKSIGMAKIELEGGPEQANDLNSSPFPMSDLLPQAYVAIAGRASETVPLIQSELNAKFPNFRPRLLGSSESNRFIAYCYLQKNLPFLRSFERILIPLTFQNQPVKSFGIYRFDHADENHQELSKQVKVLDYLSDDDFVIRLIPRGGNDEIILAKVSPEKTLSATISAVRQRIRQPIGQSIQIDLQHGETLVVPNLSANVERQFDELVNRRITTSGFSDLIVQDARQVIRFQLDENGAKLESEGELEGGIGDVDLSFRKLVFDKPFLIWLKETQATEPYFVAWIANSELMLPFDQNRER